MVLLLVLSVKWYIIIEEDTKIYGTNQLIAVLYFRERQGDSL